MNTQDQKLKVVPRLLLQMSRDVFKLGPVPDPEGRRLGWLLVCAVDSMLCTIRLTGLLGNILQNAPGCSQGWECSMLETIRPPIQEQGV